ncbi:hypothetical protein MKW94_023762 [Papaver nudicaule]|uniref:TFIIS N-terminal domain-containing protein n=1 Tax=Papaver nudicaule TaxID=74823 RepID=A0AA41VM07_PAPNU|nr:hypothetical protein [Papaver nudicaule]
MKPEELERWRKYFASAKGSDIFEVLNYGILVAATDFPMEFRIRRDRIAETLYSCGPMRKCCFASEEDANCEYKSGSNTTVACVEENEDDGRVKYESIHEFDEMDMNRNDPFCEKQTVEEVLKIKEVLLDSQNRSEEELLAAMRRLQMMIISTDTLKVTTIGKAVSGIRKHSSKQISGLARTLIEGWKQIVDMWMHANDEATAAGNISSDSGNPSVVDEGKAPSPPLKEKATDDGNLRNRPNEVSCKCIPTMQRKNTPSSKPLQPHESKVFTTEKNEPKVTRKETETRQMMAKTLSDGTKLCNNLSTVEGHQWPSLSGRTTDMNEISVQMKLEASRKRLHDGYQQAENAKKRRMIKVMDVKDLPLKSPGSDKVSHTKPKKQSLRHPLFRLKR